MIHQYSSRGWERTGSPCAGGGSAINAKGGSPLLNGWKGRRYLSSSRQPFDREKIVTGAVKSFDKRPVSIDLINNLADEVEREVRRKEVSEIPSKTIGKMVLKRLKNIDKVAWLRFASVYLELADVSEFEKLLEKISN